MNLKTVSFNDKEYNDFFYKYSNKDIKALNILTKLEGLSLFDLPQNDQDNFMNLLEYISSNEKNVKYRERAARLHKQWEKVYEGFKTSV